MFWWVYYILVYGENWVRKNTNYKTKFSPYFCLDISCILICWLTVYLNQGTCIFNPLFFLSWERERFEVFYYCGCIFRKVKLALLYWEVEAEIQEVVFAFVLSVLRLDNASELTSVSSLKWFRNVTHWPKVSVTEISPPIWYSVRLLNKSHVIENISEGGTDQNHWHKGRCRVSDFPC